MRNLFPCLRAGLHIAICGAVLFPLIGRSEEGMWTFDNPPLKELKEKYNFVPTPAWLDHLRLSSVRLNDGGSGSFVSPHGLLLTNHHVARRQLQNNSTAAHDYLKDGFYAATPDAEMKSPDLEVNVLTSMENVTERVNAAVPTGGSAEKAFAARNAVIAALEGESLKKTGLRSDVVTLYHGGEYWLYRYKKYTDVRLVFAPEQQIAFYGGDPDNFTYPRYDLDMALFRVYENGKPIETKDYLKWNADGSKDGDLVFVPGHPGSTQRLETVAGLRYQRDVVQPTAIALIKNRIAILQKYSALGPEQARQAGSRIFGLQNSLKVFEGRDRGLRDPAIFAKKEKDENEFKAAVMANPQLKAAAGNAWDESSEAFQELAPKFKSLSFHALDSDLANLAVMLVQYVAEVKKPDSERLPQYHEAGLESLRFRLFSAAPIYKELEIARMTGALELDVRELGPDHPYLKIVLNGKAPHDVATELVNGTKVGDVAFRKQLVAGGEATLAASNDPMIVLARKLDPITRADIKFIQDKVQSVQNRAGEQLGKARFAIYGRSTYPDATFTLRLSYGQVKGYPMNGTQAPSKTTFFGLYDRAASFNFEGPFQLPARYSDGRAKLDLATPLDFVTTNDMTGGNSGSPVVNREGEVVGLIFDGNIESLVGDFVYDGTQNRGVAVHTAGMTEALRKLYGVPALLDELLGR